MSLYWYRYWKLELEGINIIIEGGLESLEIAYIDVKIFLTYVIRETRMFVIYSRANLPAAETGSAFFRT